MESRQPNLDPRTEEITQDYLIIAQTVGESSLKNMVTVVQNYQEATTDDVKSSESAIYYSGVALPEDFKAVGADGKGTDVVTLKPDEFTKVLERKRLPLFGKTKPRFIINEDGTAKSRPATDREFKKQQAKKRTFVPIFQQRNPTEFMPPSDQMVYHAERAAA